MADTHSLKRLAHAAMVEHGFEPTFTEAALREARAAAAPSDGVRDLRALPWTSIDNVDSRDLDQVEGGSGRRSHPRPHRHTRTSPRSSTAWALARW